MGGTFWECLVMQTVVVLEQSDLVRELLSGLLRSRGYLVFSAETLEEAGEVVAGCSACLMVLDASLDASADGTGLLGLAEACTTGASSLLLAEPSELDRLGPIAAEMNGQLVDRGGFSCDAFVKLCQSLVPTSAAEPMPNPTAKVAATSASSAVPTAKVAPKAVPKSAGRAAESSGPRLVASSANIDEVGLLKTLTPVVERAEVDEAASRGVLLPVHPGLAGALLKLLDAGDASPADLCRAVSRDTGLTLRALAKASAVSASAASGGAADPVASLSVAVDRIGTEGLRAVVTEAQAEGDLASTFEVFEASLVRCRIDVHDSWRHGQAVALIAGEVTRLWKGSADQVQVARTAGWLHDAGRKVFAHTLGEAYAEAVEAAEALGLPLDRVEQQMMLDDHGQLMEKLLRGLGVSPVLATPAACHRLPIVEARNLSGKHFIETLTLAVADRYAAALGTGDALGDPLQGLEHHATALKLDAVQIDASLTACEKQLDSDTVSWAKAVGGVSGERLPAWRGLLDEALRDAVRPVFVGADTTADAFAVWCASVGGDAGATPNVAVVRLTNVRERDTLTGVLRGLEIEKNLGRLPLLLVSPKGNLTIEDGAMAGRTVELLAEPVSARRLAGALQSVLADASGLKDAA